MNLSKFYNWQIVYKTNNNQLKFIQIFKEIKELNI